MVPWSSRVPNPRPPGSYIKWCSDWIITLCIAHQLWFTYNTHEGNTICGSMVAISCALMNDKEMFCIETTVPGLTAWDKSAIINLSLFFFSCSYFPLRLANSPGVASIDMGYTLFQQLDPGSTGMNWTGPLGPHAPKVYGWSWKAVMIRNRKVGRKNSW